MEIRKDGSDQKSLYATRAYCPGEVVHFLRGDVYPQPSRTSIQIGSAEHIEDHFGACMNHSFDPSCFIRERVVFANREIYEGDELTFDYTTTESNMAYPFIDSETGKWVQGK